ncbi:hypothetical protein DICA2_F01156 [Diutina catenulata]
MSHPPDDHPSPPRPYGANPSHSSLQSTESRKSLLGTLHQKLTRSRDKLVDPTPPQVSEPHPVLTTEHKPLSVDDFADTSSDDSARLSVGSDEISSLLIEYERQSTATVPGTFVFSEEFDEGAPAVAASAALGRHRAGSRSRAPPPRPVDTALANVAAHGAPRSVASPDAARSSGSSSSKSSSFRAAAHRLDPVSVALPQPAPPHPEHTPGNRHSGSTDESDLRLPEPDVSSHNTPRTGRPESAESLNRASVVSGELAGDSQPRSPSMLRFSSIDAGLEDPKRDTMRSSMSSGELLSRLENYYEDDEVEVGVGAGVAMVGARAQPGSQTKEAATQGATQGAPQATPSQGATLPSQPGVQSAQTGQPLGQPGAPGTPGPAGTPGTQHPPVPSHTPATSATSATSTPPSSAGPAAGTGLASAAAAVASARRSVPTVPSALKFSLDDARSTDVDLTAGIDADNQLPVTVYKVADRDFDESNQRWSVYEHHRTSAQSHQPQHRPQYSSDSSDSLRNVVDTPQSPEAPGHARTASRTVAPASGAALAAAVGREGEVPVHAHTQDAHYGDAPVHGVVPPEKGLPPVPHGEEEVPLEATPQNRGVGAGASDSLPPPPPAVAHYPASTPSPHGGSSGSGSTPQGAPSLPRPGGVGPESASWSSSPSQALPPLPTSTSTPSTKLAPAPSPLVPEVPATLVLSDRLSAQSSHERMFDSPGADHFGLDLSGLEKGWSEPGYGQETKYFGWARWALVMVMGLVIVPLFYMMPLGLLDNTNTGRQYYSSMYYYGGRYGEKLVNRRYSKVQKVVSLVLGIVWTVIVLAMIGVGLGVGLTRG